MAGRFALRVLVAEHDHALAEDLRSILAPRGISRADGDGLFAVLEAELFGAAAGDKRFPEADVTLVSLGDEAVQAAREALAEERPFALAFVDLELAPGPDGLQTAEQLRALDPDVPIVLLSARCAASPLELCERVPPADRLFLLSKPVHPAEIQQIFLSLGTRWRAERTRRAPADRLEDLPAGVLVFDRRDRLLSANDRMLRLFPELADVCVPGTPYAEVQRQLALRLLPENRLVRVDPWLEDRLDWHARSGGVLEQRLRGGRWVLLAEGAAGSGETHCLFYDITELKQRERARASAAHMTQMVQCFAGLCDQLDLVLGRSGDSAATVAERGVAVFPGGAALHAKGGPVEALSARLRAVAQRQRLAPEPAALDRLVAEAVRQTRSALPAGVEIEVVSGAGLWPVLIDSGRLVGALAELVRNGFEAMPNGGRMVLELANVRLSREFAAAREGLPGGEYVRISVQDTGPGMSAGLAERALNPFFSSKGSKDHLGLGLSVVHGFARRSGGYVESEGGEGRVATVNLYFPRAEAPAREPDEDNEARDRSGRQALRRVVAD
jgi:signal transduction histidine kinase